MAELHRGLNLEEFRQKQLNTDIVLDCRGGVVHAHKLILASACAYFDRMFSVDMVENNSGVVNLTNFSKEAIEMVVQYLYTFQHPLVETKHMLRELIVICHMMQITSLLDLCWRQMINRHLNVDTFFEIWVVAVTFELEKASELVDFIRNNFEEILQTESAEIFTEDEMSQLLECVDQQSFCHKCVRLIFKWKSGGEREEAAANLLDKLDLSYLDDASFENLFRMSRANEKTKSIDSVIIGEAINRWPRRMNKEKAILNMNAIIVKCNSISKDTFCNTIKPCDARTALRAIGKFCETFCSTYSVPISTDSA